jgi:hypothetical protein
VSGLRDGKPVELQMDLVGGVEQEEAIQRVWSRARIDDLLEEMANNPDKSAQLRAEIISTALEARLATPFTAFVAIDPEIAITGGGSQKVVLIAQPLPRGLDRHGFIPPSWSGNSPPPSPAVMRTASMSMPPKLSKRTMQGFTGSANFKMEQNPPLPVGSAEALEGFKPDTIGENREDNLRWLARSQQVDGSWGGNVENTAAALLAFLRHGHTHSTGSFRQNVRRSFTWLETNSGSGQSRFIRALALDELARISSQPGHLAAAAAAAGELPEAVDTVEKAVYSRLHEVGEFSLGIPREMDDLTRLKIAAILQKKIDSPTNLVKEPQAGLKRTWLAVLE